MAKFNCIGFEHKVGVKKSTNQPYDLYIYHCVGDDIPETKESFGERVETVIVNGIYCGPQPIPAVLPCNIAVSYGRTGYPDSVFFVE